MARRCCTGGALARHRDLRSGCYRPDGVLDCQIQQLPCYDVRLVRGLRAARRTIRPSAACQYEPSLPDRINSQYSRRRDGESFRGCLPFCVPRSVNCCDYGQQKTRSLVGVRVSLAGAKVVVLPCVSRGGNPAAVALLDHVAGRAMPRAACIRRHAATARRRERAIARRWSDSVDCRIVMSSRSFPPRCTRAEPGARAAHAARILPASTAGGTIRRGAARPSDCSANPPAEQSSGRRGYFVSSIPGLTGNATATQRHRDAMACPARGAPGKCLEICAGWFASESR